MWFSEQKFILFGFCEYRQQFENAMVGAIDMFRIFFLKYPRESLIIKLLGIKEVSEPISKAIQGLINEYELRKLTVTVENIKTVAGLELTWNILHNALGSDLRAQDKLGISSDTPGYVY